MRGIAWSLSPSGSRPEAFIDLQPDGRLRCNDLCKESIVLFPGVEKVCNRNWYRNLELRRGGNGNFGPEVQRDLVRALCCLLAEISPFKWTNMLL